jgi:hypothetical protein
MSSAAEKSFQGEGRWLGSAEVYSGDGQFLGNGLDMRRVERAGEGLTRIDVTFIGPMKAAGHYHIQEFADHRVYLGPVNVGYADLLAPNLVDANAYWPTLGLSQRFFLMVLEDRQLSLALMSRGERLLYAVVGENERVTGPDPLPRVQTGTSYDLAGDPRAGRAHLLLHRNGAWRGTLSFIEGPMANPTSHLYQEVRQGDTVCAEGQRLAETWRVELHSDGWQAWTPPGDVVGSYSLYGGRALSGVFHHTATHYRVWRREVADLSGTTKAVLNTWYVGQKVVGHEFGVLTYEAAP